MAPLLLPSWRVHVSTWLRFFLGNRLGPYHAMPQHVIDGMLNLAQVGSADVLYDVGCGDGRLLLEAARQRRIAQGVGLEVNPTLAALAQSNVDVFSAAHPHLSSRLSVVHCDARRVDSLGSASVVTLYLSERGNRQLKPLLARHLRQQPGSRVVSFCFDMPAWRPRRRAQVSGIPLYLFDANSLQQDKSAALATPTSAAAAESGVFSCDVERD